MTMTTVSPSPPPAPPPQPSQNTEDASLALFICQSALVLLWIHVNANFLHFCNERNELTDQHQATWMDGWTDRLTQPLIEMQGCSKNIDSNNLHNLSLPSSHFSLSHDVFVLPP